MLRFSSQLQMHPLTKLHSHFPSRPLNKRIIKSRPRTPPYSSEPTLLLYFLRATSPQFSNSEIKSLEKMMKQISSFLLLLAMLHLCTKTSGQSSSSGVSDVTSVLRKSGKFTTFIGLLKKTQMDEPINSQLQKASSQGFTIFAPTDSAFSDLTTGTLNSFTDEQKVKLAQFHIIPTFLAVSQFQTVSNPVRTEAGNDAVDFPLNVISNGTQVNITTGLVNTTVDSTVYSDGQLAVYEIGDVLLSQGILGTGAPAPAPLPPMAKKASPPNSQAPSRSTTASVDSSGATCLLHCASMTIGVLAILSALFS